MSNTRITLSNGGATIVNGELALSKAQIEYADNELMKALSAELWQDFLTSPPKVLLMVRCFVLLSKDDQDIFYNYIHSHATV